MQQPRPALRGKKAEPRMPVQAEAGAAGLDPHSGPRRQSCCVHGSLSIDVTAWKKQPRESSGGPQAAGASQQPELQAWAAGRRSSARRETGDWGDAALDRERSRRAQN